MDFRAAPGGFTAAALAIGSLLIAAATTVPADATTLAAVFPPWWSASRALDAATRAGDVLAFGSSSHVVIISSRRANLPARLRLAGAIIMLNPIGARACDPSSSGTENETRRHES